MNTNDTKTCLACGAPVKGRSDKKFCDDQCRSSYNNSLNSDVSNYMRTVNNILRKNRRILETLNVDGKTKVPKSKLLLKGYNFDYHTNTLHTKAGKTYFFCYEHGFLPIENDWVMLVVRNEEK